MADVNQTFGNEKEKVSQEDVRKGMGEPELEQVLEGDSDVQGELYHFQIEEDFLDEQPCYRPIQEVVIDLLDTGK